MSQTIPPAAHTREEILPYLRDILCELFDTPEAALSVADAAGLSRAYLLVDGPVNAIWDRILKEANKRDGYSTAILNEARRQYPDNTLLLQAIACFVTARDIARADLAVTLEIAGLREDIRLISDRWDAVEKRVAKVEEDEWALRRGMLSQSRVKATSLLIAICLINLPVALFAGYTAHDHGINYWGLIVGCLFIWAIAFVFFAYSVGVVKEETYRPSEPK